MPQRLYLLFVLAFFAMGTLVEAEPPDFVATVGTVENFGKESVKVTFADAKKSVDLKITGTSSFSFPSKQLRLGKTVVTQRKAKATDLAKGQSIAVIYTEADHEFILLHAVLQPVEEIGALGEADILDIAKAQVAKNESWSEHAEYTLTKERDGWTVVVWRIPKTPGGVRYISIDRKGNVLKYIRGI